MRVNTQNPKIAVALIILTVLVVSVLFGQIVAGSSKYALPVVLVAIVFLVTMVNTDAGLAILIFSMLLSPEITLARVPGRDVVIRAEDILLAVITFSWLAKMAINKGLAIFVKTPLNKIIGLYLFFCYVSTFWGMALGYVGLEKGFFYLLRYTEYFLLFILVANQIHSRKQIRFFLATFFIVCAIVSVIGILQIPSGQRVTAPFEGEVGEPNTFGGYLLFILCIAIGIYLHNVSPRLKMAMFALSALIIFPFFYTLSRASYSAMIFSFLAFVVLSKKKVALVSVMMTLILAGILLKPEAIFSRVKYTFQEQQSNLARIGNIYLDSSSSERIFSWREGFLSWKKNPLLGRGVTGFHFIDGQYILVLAEQGILGFLAFLWLLWIILKQSLNVLRKTKDELFKGITLGFITGFIGLMIHAVTANTFIIVRIMEPFWFFAAIIMMHPTLKKGEYEQEKLVGSNTSGSNTQVGPPARFGIITRSLP
jgi:O-antigen ligase